jgi:hypothetical protein
MRVSPLPASHEQHSARVRVGIPDLLSERAAAAGGCVGDEDGGDRPPRVRVFMEGT